MPDPGAAQRRLIALVQILGLSAWFSATAVAPSLRSEWDLTPASEVWLTASVQVGFVVGAVLSSSAGLADRLRANRLVAGCAIGAGTSTLALVVAADGLALAVPLRFLTGVFLAGIYPVNMKLMASWSEPVSRGRAFGLLIGCLTLGSALPHLIAGLGPLPWRAVMLAAAAASFAAAAIAWLLVRTGPLVSAAVRPRARDALEGLRVQRLRLINLGYFGHMWELYAFWTWLPAYVRATSGGEGLSPGWTSVLVFAVIGLGGLAGAVVGGRVADRRGRPTAAIGALLLSGSCCLLSPAVFWAPTLVLVLFLLLWGAAVIADSGVFSTAMSENAVPDRVGTALTVQTAVGFSLTVVAIQLTPLFADLVGWQSVFLLLAPGPALGAYAMYRFSRLPARGTPAAT